MGGFTLTKNEQKVKYVGEDSADLRKGKMYDAMTLEDTEKLIGIKDMSGEWYAYPAYLFEGAN